MTAKHRVLLTGTPLQNSLEELFYLMNFLEPHKFSNVEQFKAAYAALNDRDKVCALLSCYFLVIFLLYNNVTFFVVVLSAVVCCLVSVSVVQVAAMMWGCSSRLRWLHSPTQIEVWLLTCHECRQHHCCIGLSYVVICQVSELHRQLAPHMLRRLKKDVLKQLPPKMEQMVGCV